jgi:hypothetical protein
MLKNINDDFLYPMLFRDLEKARWSMANDINWDSFDINLLTEEQAITIKMNAITEWSALPATEMFLRDNKHDSDFSAFMSIWFYEEQKHSLVLMEYLRRFRPDLLPTESELHAVRFEFDPAPELETLMLHFCGEMRLTQWYKKAAQWHTEPVIKQIYKTLSTDEARHGSAYLKYMQKAVNKIGDKAKLAFAKIGILMASSKIAGKPLHPTNLHVSQEHYPYDTVQSRLPDPSWLENWLDKQIKFDIIEEKKVIRTIFNNLSNLFNEVIETTSDLNKLRKNFMLNLRQ